jgi:hypothetical protein
MKLKAATNAGSDDCTGTVVTGKILNEDHQRENEDDLRRLKKLQRRAKKMAAHFAALGLDEFGEPLDNFSLLKYPVREWRFTPLGFQEPIAINPVVTFISGLLLWGSVLISICTYDQTPLQ